MNKLYSKLFLSLFLLLCSFCMQAQVSVTATAGTTGPTSYTTLKGAFDAINSGTHQGVITVTITGNTTESASASINAPTTPASYTAINVGTSGAFTISMNAATALIQFNGATNVTFNGNSTLILNNSNPGGVTVRFVNDATNNMVKNTTIRGTAYALTGAAGLATTGIVFFGTGVNTGNDGNILDNCNIDGGGAAVSCLYSKGLTSAAANENSGNIVRNCRMHDNINDTASSSAAIYLDQGNTGWNIQNNSLYDSLPLNSSKQYLLRSMLIVPTYTTDADTVSGNYIGGSGALATGTMSLMTSSTNAIGYIAMDIETGGGSLVQNNVIKNINLTYSAAAGSFTNSGIFGFIGGYNGNITITGNTISNLTFANNTGFLSMQAIHVNARVTASGTVTPTYTVTNNTISSLTMNSGGTGDVQMHGIRLETSSGTGLTVAAASKPTFTVTGNTISNISLPYAGTAASFIRAIGTITTEGTGATALLYPKVDISSNTINTITTAAAAGSAAAGTGINYTSGVITGVHFGGSAGGFNTTDVQNINKNLIYNLNATNTGNVNAVVFGVLVTTGVHNIAQNRIYDLKNAASGLTQNPGIVGIEERKAVGPSQIVNNMITLGNGLTNNISIFGVINNFDSVGPINVSYNSIVVTGSGAVGNTKPTFALLRGTDSLGNSIKTPMVIKDNILYNTRSGGGLHYTIGNTFTATPLGWTSDYNDLYSSTASTIALWGTTSMDLASYKNASGDANSNSFTVNFAGVSTGDLHLVGSSLTDIQLNGTPISGITVDYDNDPRSATIPTKGADERPSCTPAAITSASTPSPTVCANSSVTFTVNATGTAPLSYLWYFNNNPIGTATNSTYTINSVTTGNSGNYTVTVTNGCGTATSNPISLTVNNCTATSNISEDVIASTLLPNIVRNNAVLRVNTKTAALYNWTITDARGSVVMRFTKQLASGPNDMPLQLAGLTAGTYQLNGISAKGNITLRFVKQ